ncbi:MAG: hypothetical protein CL910_16630 [Deltaproteobacteria bacterium]|nr:hypothetical protein [Deltaproteobacteria bacterium]
MELEIGPSFRKYGESEAYRRVTRQNRGKASIGRDGSLAGYTGGLPFPTDAIDCAGDPEAGSKIVWNFSKAWNGDGAAGRFLFTMWDRGEKIPMYYEGTSRRVMLKDRVEPQYREDAESPGDIFEDEDRLHATGLEITAPARHSFSSGPYRLLTYRYDSADGPLDRSSRDDVWVYVPVLQHSRRWLHKRPEAMSEFTFDDLRSFSGMPPQYDWACLGEKEVLTPFNTKRLAYPYRDDYDFGPYGTSYANDRWELRKAWVIRLEPKEEFAPHHPRQELNRGFLALLERIEGFRLSAKHPEPRAEPSVILRGLPELWIDFDLRRA